MNMDLERDEKLVSAAEAFESTKEPQLKNVIAEINAARKRGECSATIVGEALHKETIEAVLEAGYDMDIKEAEGGFLCFIQIIWDKEASGKIREK